MPGTTTNSLVHPSEPIAAGELQRLSSALEYQYVVIQELAAKLGLVSDPKLPGDAPAQPDFHPEHITSSLARLTYNTIELERIKQDLVI